MIDLFNKSDIQKAEKSLFDKGISAISLIEKAGAGLSREIDGEKVAIVVGAGNNGADGLCSALYLLNQGKKGDIFKVGDVSSLDSKYFENRLLEKGIAVKDWTTCDFSSYDVVVDCIFGIGLNREIGGEYRNCIEKLNASKTKVVSADIPSGLNADTGKVMGVAVKADKTVSFSGMKTGYLFADGQDYTGEIVFCDTGIYPENSRAKLIDEYRFEKRKKNTHKGSYGKVSLITGSANYVGAAILSARGALRSGAGLLRLCVPQSLQKCYQERIIEPILTILPDDGQRIVFDQPSLDEIIKWSDVIALGMGLGQSEGVRACVEYVVKNAKCPVLLDADGLNAVCHDVELLKLGQDIVLTPHLGEFARLIGKDTADIEPLTDAVNFAKEYGVCLHLKGCASITAYPDGKVFVTASGTPAMAKGGSGDVLSGIASSFIAQGVENAVAVASFIHGEAGLIASEKFGEYGTLASDIADAIPFAMKNHR